MKVTITIPDDMAAEARTLGMSVEGYVQEILTRQKLGTTGEDRLPSVRKAVERILEVRKGNKLTGIKTKDLVHEVHKY